MTSKITYRRLKLSFSSLLKVENEAGLVTTFSDTLAYSCFLQGAATLHANGVDITVLDEDGVALVGSLDELDPMEVARG